MNFVKILGLFCLFCITFIYTEEVINVSINQDEIMIKIKETAEEKNINPINAIIKDDTITPGKVGKHIDTDASYKAMKKIGTFESSLLIYTDIYPEISIHNNYNKYITIGNNTKKEVSLIYILNNNNTINDILNIIEIQNTHINFFIDSQYLNNNISIINKIKNYEIYNYGNNGKYTKDNIIITNNIINNKSNNNSTFCLFLEKDNKSLNNCANNLMLSLIPNIKGNYNNIKNNLKNGSIILINNTKELNSIIEYINTKGYNIVPLSKLIQE